jgi:hypothetical protein
MAVPHAFFWFFGFSPIALSKACFKKQRFSTAIGRKAKKAKKAK